MPSSYYRPSGRCAPRAPLFVALAIGLTVPFAWILAWTSFHLNTLMVSVATLGYAVFLLTCAFAVAEHGKVRSPALLTVFALAIGLAGWYVQWAQFAAMLAQSFGATPATFAHFLTHPAQLAAIARNQSSGALGTWGALEFLLFAMVPALLARSAASEPFCELSRSWVQELKLDRLFAPIEDDAMAALKAALEADPESLMSFLAAPAPGADRFTALSLFPCEGAEQAWVSVWNVSRVVKDGKNSDAHSCIVKHLAIPADLARHLLAECETGTDEQAETPAPAELRAALQALHAEDFAQAMTLAAPYCSAAQTDLRGDANRICALCCSRLGRWMDASRYWVALFEHEQNGHNALQVASSLAMAGQLANGEEWFAKARDLNEGDASTPPVLMYISFITALKNSGNVRAALPYLAWVKALYQELHITDATFLTLRGVPFFVSFLEQSAPIVDASMDAGQAKAWYQAMLPHIDQDGQDQLNAWLGQRAYA